MMDTIHVVYGSERSAKAAFAHRLAVRQRDALVHEIGGHQDLRLIAGSRYHRCIAILDAGDERNARLQMRDLALRADVDLCPMTFEAAPRP
jgi:hypothetical protein